MIEAGSYLVIVLSGKKNYPHAAFSTKREELESALGEAKAMRDFFAGMPWRALS